MDIGRAFSYIFEDQEWTVKLLISGIMAFVGVITLPLLVGFVAWAALLGYLADLIRNLRAGRSTPMPRWDNYPDKIRSGGSVLTAVLLYNLPNLLPLCCTLTTSTLGSDSLFGGALSFAMTCCVFPLLLLYNVVTWPMLALGLARFSEERNIGVFFQFGDLFNTVYGSLGLTGQWVIFTFIINFGLGIVGAIPCLGWLVAPALAIPLHAYLIAHYAEGIERSAAARYKA